MPDDPNQPEPDDAETPAQGEQQQAETDWKTEARKWEQRAKENKARLDEAAPKLSEYDALVEASKSDLERARESEQRWQSEAETWRKAAVGNRIEALASADFADTSDAVTALADGSYLDAGGQIDEAQIRADLAAVLEKKPHWRRAEAPSAPRIPAPNPAQGSGSGRSSADPAQEFAAILQGQLNGR